MVRDGGSWLKWVACVPYLPNSELPMGGELVAVPGVALL